MRLCAKPHICICYAPIAAPYSDIDETKQVREREWYIYFIFAKVSLKYGRNAVDDDVFPDFNKDQTLAWDWEGYDNPPPWVRLE